MKAIQRLAAALLSMAFAAPAFSADYYVTVEPNYPPAQAQEVYKPLMAYLSRATGHTFRVRAAPNYHVHWRDLRTGVKTDFAFEEAHFTDYRVQRFGFAPLVRVQEPTKFSLLVDPSNKAAGTRGLIGNRIVSMPAPSLGYLLLNELYTNPIAQPEIQSVAASWKDGVEMVFAQETDGAMVPNYIASQYPNLDFVHETRELTGRALSAAPGVPADVRKAVTTAMLNLHKDNNLIDVLTELGTAQFVATNAAEYSGNERLLRGVFGYVAKAAAKPAAAPAKPAAAPAKPAAAPAKPKT